MKLIEKTKRQRSLLTKLVLVEYQIKGLQEEANELRNKLSETLKTGQTIKVFFDGEERFFGKVKRIEYQFTNAKKLMGLIGKKEFFQVVSILIGKLRKLHDDTWIKANADTKLKTTYVRWLGKNDMEDKA